MSGRKRESRNSSLTIGSNVLQALFENGKSPLSVQFIRWKLWRRWPEFVGPTIAQYSEPVGYNKGVLILWVKNSSWLQQLVFMREHIAETINKKLECHYVKEVRLTLDRKSVPQDAEISAELKDQIANLMAESDEKP